MRSLLSLPLLLLWPLTATAHPHIFVDTGFEVILDDRGQITHVRVIWEYDDFYSLLITEDLGLDQDGDGKMTEAEIATLSGFDMKWIDGFNGDLVALNGTTPVPLSAPQEFGASYSEGRITTTHLRALDNPVPAGATLTLKPYDPTYYTAYEATLPITFQPDSACMARRTTPEPDASLVALQQKLAELDMATDPEDAGLPDIGAQLADSVIVTCAAS